MLTKLNLYRITIELRDSLYVSEILGKLPIDLQTNISSANIRDEVNDLENEINLMT